MKPNPAHPVVGRILRRTLAGVASVLLPLSCGPAYIAPPVDKHLTGVSRSPVSLLERGYSIHQAKCAKCHPFENPANYSPEALTFDIMPVMARKSKIDQADKEAVTAYLLDARELPPPAATP